MEFLIMKRNSRGFTLIELLVVIAIIALLMGLLLPALAKAMDNARVRKDQAQLKGVASSFSIFGESNDGSYPVPGDINRGAANITGGYAGVYQGAVGGQIQGIGPKDDNINISGFVHSYMIGDNGYGTNNIISANEQNPMVAAKGDEGSNPDEVAYDFAAVDIASDSYWDPLFSGDISGEGQGANVGGVNDVCHTSFANMALCGKRLDRWMDGASNTVVLSSRGPEIRSAGDMTSDNFSKSPTLELYGPSELWEGIFVVADGSTHYANDFWCKNKEYISRGEYTIFKDNVFQAEFNDYDNSDSLGNAGGASGDNFMVLNVESTKTDVRQVNDILYP
jgi:prepilin-type N-terminal cleavage/methylation domain-containing protein